MAGNNLKTRVTADTSDFKKGMKEAKAALKDFEKQGTSAISSMEGMLGGASGSISQVANNIKNATALFRQMASSGGAALTTLERGMAALGGAIAGLGLTAVVAAFKQLNTQAATFRDTMEGIQFEAGLQAYRDTFNAVIEDSTGTGETWSTFWGEQGRKFGDKFTKAAMVGLSWVKNIGRKGLNVLSIDTQEIEGYRTIWKNAEDAAMRSRELEEDIQGIERNRLRNQVEWAKLSREAIQLERIASDNSEEASTRQDALNLAIEKYNQLYSEQAEYARQISEKRKEQSGLATDSAKAEKVSIDAQSETDRILGEQEIKMKSLQKLQNRINSTAGSHAKAAKETQEATELTLAAATQMVEKQRELQAIQDQNNAMMAAARFSLDGGLAGGPGIQPGQAQRMTVPALVRPVVDPQEWIDVSEELKGIIEDALGSIGDSIGQLMGDLATGGDAWGNFTNNAIQAFGEMATTVGKIAVSTGLATLGIKAALESLNPYVAIAAGTALIALGAAVRAGMANAASGSYSTSVASSAYSSSGAFGQSSFGREMEVKVTGTLTANGSKLVAVLNNEKNRTDYTT